MAKEGLITGVDIGTFNTKVLVAARTSQGGDLELVAYDKERSDGIRRGTVVGIERTSDILKELIYKISEDLGERIGSVYINVNGSHLFSVPSRGLVSVSRADEKISQEDVQRVWEEAKAINLSSNKKIFEVYPKEYIIDGVRGIREPLGLEGVRLEVEVLALGGFSPYLENTKKAVLDAELEILDMVPSVVASARAVLTDDEKERGVVVLDIGAGVTNIAVFEEGRMIHLAVLPMGSSNITNDVAIGLKIDIDTAERIKIEYGSCSFKGRKDKKRKINIGGDEALVFSQKLLVEIISDRVSEILEQANKELKDISKNKRLPGGVVLTGGGAKFHNIIDLAKKKFELPVRLGRPRGIMGLEDDLEMASVCGLVLLGNEWEGKKEGFGLGRKIISKIKKAIRIFIP